MKPKLTALILTIALAITLLAACNGGNGGNGEGDGNNNATANTPEEPPPPTQTLESPTTESTPEAPHEHEWKEANYQEAQTCLICGETDGEPLTPGFVLHGVEANAEIGVKYPYVTGTSRGDRETIGEIELLQVDRHLLANKPGYDIIIANFELTFGDRNAQDFGIYYSSGTRSYYEYDPSSPIRDFVRDGLEGDMPGFMKDSVNYYGEEVETYTNLSDYGRWDLDSRVFTEDFWVYYLVPSGYDGLVVCFYDSRLESETVDEGKEFDDNALIYRITGDYPPGGPLIFHIVGYYEFEKTEWGAKVNVPHYYTD